MSSGHFLKNLAEHCYHTFGNDCDRLTIIFPNKRAGVYFARYLSQLFDQPVWSPNIYSFEEFVIGTQEELLADELQLNLLLYEAYKTLIPEPESFDAFLPWGEMILKDFNDIDNYLVDPAHIFRVVKSQKELDESFQFLSVREQKVIQQFWSSFLPNPTKKQEEFIQTWSVLQELYELFNRKLAEKKLTTKGRVFRSYAEKEDSNKQLTWFAGFNALTGAEELIIKRFLKTVDNDIFWDIDAYYFNDENQESGQFFREYAKDPVFEQSIKRDLKDSFSENEKSLDVVSAPFGAGQLMIAVQTLEAKLHAGIDAADILVVLTDEGLLSSFLKLISPSIENVNVTMGWPLANSRFFLLLSKILELMVIRNEKSFSNFHKKEVEAFFEYNDLIDLPEGAYENFKKAGLKSNKLYYAIDEFLILFPNFRELISSQKSVDLHLIEVINFLKNTDTTDWPELEKSVISLVHQKLKQVHKSILEAEVILEMKSFLKLFTKIGQSVKVPLSGDPNKGLQVMGILETRNLTFEHVIIIGMNEGAWPKESANASFIPYNIRMAFELPVTFQQDAMQSYLFYRLVQSAQNIWISFNNIAEFNHNGELSRYVQQLKHESSLKIKEQNVVSRIEGEGIQEIIIKKEGKTKESLFRYLKGHSNPQKRLSPSALNTYLDCQLKFYFRYVKNLYEPKEVIEDLDPSLLGNLLHGGMEHLYKDNDVLDPTTLKSLSNQIDKAVKLSFEDQKLSMDDDEKIGRQLIAFEVVKKYMEAILAFDEKNSPFEILGLEKEYEIELPIELSDSQEYVALKGIIDRIDQKDGVVRIIDYKSGRDERTFKNVDALVDGELEKRDKAVFQLFYYCVLYKLNHKDNQLPLRPGIFNSKDLLDRGFDMLVYKKPKKAVLDFAEYEEDYLESMNLLLTQIFNISIDFKQTEDLKKCQYCPYQQICMRG
ncbi:MAG: PD-(D/E)XK nuclease family protein [Reichenbachiella sp.]